MRVPVFIFHIWSLIVGNRFYCLFLDRFSFSDWKYQICSYSFSIFDRKSIQMKCALRTRMHNYIENDGILFLYNVIVYNIDTDRHKQSNKANCVHKCIYCTWPHVSMLNCDCKYIVIKIASILSQNDCAYSFVYWLHRAVESLKWVTLWW